MPDIVNLNKFRKVKRKETRRKQADANAVNFGRTRAERDLDKLRQARALRDHDDKQRE